MGVTMSILPFFKIKVLEAREIFSVEIGDISMQLKWSMLLSKTLCEWIGFSLVCMQQHHLWVIRF